MNEATRTRIELARRNATRYAEHPNVRAIMVVGSVAHGLADDNSDIDCTIFYDRSPSEQEFDAICAAAKRSGGDLYYGTPDDGFAVYQYVEGIRCDFGFETIESAERTFADLLERPDTDPIKQLVAGGFLDGLPLYGEAWIAGWQARLANYPPALGPAMVRKHLRFYPRWVLEKMGFERGEWLFLYEALIEAEQNILGILCGLNQRYHPGKVKGIAWTIGKLAVKPPELLPRLEQVLRGEPDLAIGRLSELIDETLTLVETHMPEIDTARTREVLAMQLRK
jgi:nucleotidyltransferase-like protein